MHEDRQRKDASLRSATERPKSTHGQNVSSHSEWLPGFYRGPCRTAVGNRDPELAARPHADMASSRCGVPRPPGGSLSGLDGLNGSASKQPSCRTPKAIYPFNDSACCACAVEC